jgi:RNA polymerase sigma-70 factor (ECF subfamily)
MNATAIRSSQVPWGGLEAAAVSEPKPETARFPLAKTAASRLIHAEIANPRTRERLIATAIGILGNGNQADAEDCVQEALILAARNAEQFEGRSSPTSWLFRVVVNACRMQRRAMRRERRGGGAVHVSIDDLAFSHPAADATSDPEQIIAGRDILQIVIEELDQIPEKDSKLFERHVLEDLPLRDLAKESRLTRQAVKSRLFRVRRRIADRLSA